MKGRPVHFLLLGVLWLVCAGFLWSMGGGNWATRAILLLGLLAGIVAYLVP